MRWAWIFHVLPELMQHYNNVRAALSRDFCQVTYITATLSGSNSVDNGVIFWAQGSRNLLLLGAISCPSLRTLCRFMGNHDTHNEKYPFHYPHKRPTVLYSFILCLLTNSYLNFMKSGWSWPSKRFILSMNVVFQTPFFLVYCLPAELR